MKRTKLMAIGILLIAALTLAGCSLAPVVDPDAPVASISFDEPVFLDIKVLFNGGASIDPDGGDIVYGYWDFGDGNSVEGEWALGFNPVIYVSHTYVQTGPYTGPYTYTVSLLVRDDEGSFGRTERTVNVR